jgi:Glycosyl transferases group 1
MLRDRPSVRVLLGIERRLGPMGLRAGSVLRWLHLGGERLALTAGALPQTGRRRAPEAAESAPSSVPWLTRSIALAVVGVADPAWVRELPPGLEIVRVADPASVRHALARAIETEGPDLVGVVAATSEPSGAGWLARLSTAMAGGAVAAVPMVVHPHRPLLRATPHDGLVRSAGVALRLDGVGTPTAEAIEAGATPDLAGEVTAVDAGSGAALLVDRVAYEAAGGLAAADDLDAAVVELCTHLRARGGRVVVVPGAVVVDHRPVRTRRELRFAVDPAGGGWAATVERSGSALRRAADPRACPPLQIAVTLAAPSAKVAERWGDWHLAQALAGSLRRLGQEVRVQTANQSDHLAGRSCDVHVVLRGVRPVRRTPGQHHVLWIISHPEAVDDEELDTADLVLVASPRFAGHVRRRTSTPVEVLLQATDHRRFTPRLADPAHRHDVTVVAKTRDVLRPVVADALAAGLRPRIYGGGWGRLVDPDLVVADNIDNEMLPVVYSSAGVVLNDHWRTMRAWGFVSNRLFDVLACGTPVISDPVDGLGRLFDGAVLEYHTPTGLRALVDDVLANPEDARRRAERGRRLVLAKHTFDHRARQLLDCLAQRVGVASRC